MFLKVTLSTIAGYYFLNHFEHYYKTIRHCLVGKFYLVDARYAYKTGFLPPYRGVRYHLSKYGPRHYPTNARELYNLRHSSLRVSIKRAFGTLKNRF